MNSINQVVEYLNHHPLRTETHIMRKVWGVMRTWKRLHTDCNGCLYQHTYQLANKKYAELIRRGLASDKIRRIWVPKHLRRDFLMGQSQYLYYSTGSQGWVDRYFANTGYGWTWNKDNYKPYVAALYKRTPIQEIKPEPIAPELILIIEIGCFEAGL